MAFMKNKWRLCKCGPEKFRQARCVQCGDSFKTKIAAWVKRVDGVLEHRHLHCIPEFLGRS